MINHAIPNALSSSSSCLAQPYEDPQEILSIEDDSAKLLGNRPPEPRPVRVRNLPWMREFWQDVSLLPRFNFRTPSSSTNDTKYIELQVTADPQSQAWYVDVQNIGLNKPQDPPSPSAPLLQGAIAGAKDPSSKLNNQQTNKFALTAAMETKLQILQAHCTVKKELVSEAPLPITSRKLYRQHGQLIFIATMWLILNTLNSVADFLEPLPPSLKPSPKEIKNLAFLCLTTLYGLGTFYFLTTTGWHYLRRLYYFSLTFAQQQDPVVNELIYNASPRLSYPLRKEAYWLAHQFQQAYSVRSPMDSQVAPVKSIFPLPPALTPTQQQLLAFTSNLIHKNQASLVQYLAQAGVPFTIYHNLGKSSLLQDLLLLLETKQYDIIPRPYLVTLMTLIITELDSEKRVTLLQDIFENNYNLTILPGLRYQLKEELLNFYYPHVNPTDLAAPPEGDLLQEAAGLTLLHFAIEIRDLPLASYLVDIGASLTTNPPVPQDLDSPVYLELASLPTPEEAIKSLKNDHGINSAFKKLCELV